MEYMEELKDIHQKLSTLCRTAMNENLKLAVEIDEIAREVYDIIEKLNTEK